MKHIINTADELERYINKLKSKGIRIIEVSALPKEYTEQDWYKHSVEDDSTIYKYINGFPSDFPYGNNLLSDWHFVHAMDVTEDIDEIYSGFAYETIMYWPVFDAKTNKPIN